MTNKELHWLANDMLNKSIFSVQVEIEEYKKELKRKNSVSAIHGLIGVRQELLIFEYMQELLDQNALEKSTMETVQKYLKKVQGG